MFCTNCGTKAPDDAVFCPECGTRMAVVREEKDKSDEGSARLQVTVPSFSGNISPDALIGFLKDGSAVPGKAVAAVQVVLTLLSLLPLLSLNVIIYSTEISMPTLFPTLSSISNYAGGAPAGYVYAWAIALFVIWLAAVLLSVLDVVSAVKGAKTCGLGSVLHLALGVAVLLTAFGFNAYIAGKSVLSMNVLSATPWAWVLLVLAAAFVVLLAKKGGISKPEIAIRR